MGQNQIRNFCIIAHIDDGKSTLADRLLEQTGTILKRAMQKQVLDQMELERERGITIKAKAVRMPWLAPDGKVYQLNLIDTPGHVDFTYEVSRSLTAVEGALLVVDASQGIQAQTLANAYAALEHNLYLIPVINKIDLTNARTEEVSREIESVFGFNREEIICISAKEGKGTDKILNAIIRHIPPPAGSKNSPLKALIFDSKYDSYKGVIAFIRVIDGVIKNGENLRLMSNDIIFESLEIGIFSPEMDALTSLQAGEVGYVATGLKNVTDCHVGDTITTVINPAFQPLSGYREAKPMVFAGLYPIESNEYPALRDALDKLKLSDASISYEPESSTALGFGFRCKFLGLLHMDIVQERLEREYGLRLLVTAPNVAYKVIKRDGSTILVDNPAKLPPPQEISEMQEPWLSATIITPDRYIGPVMELLSQYRGRFERLDYLSGNGETEASFSWKQVSVKFTLSMGMLLANFYDQLKSATQGYASLDYTPSGYQTGHLVKLDILVNGQQVDALSRIVPSGIASSEGRILVDKLRALIPRQLFDVAIQAAVGGKVIARETVKALRKNVLAKCYGGDVSRKRKLLEKQAEGKKRLKRIGQVEIPQEAFMAVLKKNNA